MPGKLAQPKDAGEVMREALIVSALESAAKAEEIGLAGDRIILSCKVSAVQDLISVYRRLAARCDYPLHLGLTEAGMGSKGIVASTAAFTSTTLFARSTLVTGDLVEIFVFFEEV